MSKNKSVRCYFPHSKGGVHFIEAQAQFLTGENREIAGIKLANGDKTLQKQFKEVTETARLSEFKPDYNWKVNCHISPDMPDDDQSWQLAAIIVDRMARGLMTESKGRIFALGASAQWETGQVSPLPNDVQHSRCVQALKHHIKNGDTLYLADNQQALSQSESYPVDINIITHLGDLTGQPNPYQSIRRAKAYFPLINGNTELDCLASVIVTVLPLSKASLGEEAIIRCQGNLSRTQQRQVKKALEQARAFDQQTTHQWQTSVRFSCENFQDHSYQLALVMADRIARGREAPAQNRLIASGCSKRWANGEIHNVEHQSSKLQLLQNQAQAYDRILLPAEWQSAVQAMNCWQDKSVSIACLDSLDIKL